ncbi:MAG TPA: ATP-binding protein [Thermoanaerobaculia bacterium]|nr:ATP-binding protein [Thermoanaerobaculia bacterium]
MVTSPPQSNQPWRRPHDESLRQSEERFRLLVESVRDYAIFMLDPEGYVVSWNAGAERIKGYRAGEILGLHFSEFYPAETVTRGWPQYELEVAKHIGRFEDEGLRVRKDGSTFWANVVITALYDPERRLVGFAKVTRDLTERKRIENLEADVVRRNQFLAMLAHELRNPLAPIANALGLMKMDTPAGSVLDWPRTVIERQIAHLTRLVDDLLDVSRITANKITLEKEPVEIAGVVSSAVESSRPLIDARRHTLETLLAAEPLRVEGDQTRLSQVIVNLLNNAAKYTPEGGRIWLTVEKEEESAIIRVRDNGMGISADLLPKVFEPFIQGERALDRAEGGLGIGLSLVKQLVALHGGSVRALSEGAGRGSEMIVRLPLLDYPADLRHRQSANGAPPAEGSEPRPETGSRRVLVVDDNRDAAETLATLLEHWGFAVRSACDGPAALTTAAVFLPEVVLLDIGLPGMSGYEVARHLRAMPGLHQAMLVAVTGYGQDDDRRQSREAGFDHHLVKPVDPQRLRELIASTPA